MDTLAEIRRVTTHQSQASYELTDRLVRSTPYIHMTSYVLEGANVDLHWRRGTDCATDVVIKIAHDSAHVPISSLPWIFYIMLTCYT